MFERPAHIKRLVDYMIGGWPDQARIDADKIGFFGFSRGGYAGLVFIGGIPDLHHAAGLCPDEPRLPFSGQLRDPERPAYTPVHDARIKAAVIADPGFRMLFGPDSLKTVTVPVQLWASERGGDGVLSKFIEDVKGLLPSPPGLPCRVRCGTLCVSGALDAGASGSCSRSLHR